MIYLDHNATTPCDERVLNKMLPFFKQEFANPSSNHALGWMAKEIIENTTQGISQKLGVLPREIIYTSGATESINMVLKGVWYSATKGKHIITCKTEHKAVLDTCYWLKKQGASVTFLNVDEHGIVDMEELKCAINNNTVLVAIMLANNETGTVQPIKKIAQICKEHEVPLFSDATQALGKISLDDFFGHVDYACFSAHKFYGPKGIGFAYIKQTGPQKFESFIQGGGQQNGLRGGTLNTPLIVGLGSALELAYQEFDIQQEKMASFRDTLEKELLRLEGTHLNGHPENRIPGTTNISFEYVDGANLLRALNTKLAISNGSACNSASVEPSHVLMAMGVPRDMAFASLRLGIGKDTTVDEIKTAIEIIKKEVALLREQNILWERRMKRKA